MQLHNIRAAYSLAQTLYGVDPTPQEFEDIALNAGEMIGTKHTRLYRYVTNTTNCAIELPCNVDILESVHIPIEDAQMTSNKTLFNGVETLFIENYIEAGKRSNDPYYTSGKLVKYREGNNCLYFSRNHNKVMIVYHGICVDEEFGLPLVNDKEINAIAAYVAYSLTYREGLKRRDKFLVEIAQVMKQDGLKYCNAARIPDHFSQNDMNAILDVKTRGDRKQYGKSMKPIL